ncbi:MAG: HAMP domain-containing sensor histidine kinase [Myxococcota bacterium]
MGSASARAASPAIDARTRDEIAALKERVAELEAFTAVVRHDLRTPLTAIQGFSDLLISGFGSVLGTRGRDFVERILEGAQRIEDLVAASTRVADASRLPIRPQSVDLSHLVRAVLTELARSNPDRLVTVDIAPDVVVIGDPALLERVVRELLANAWRATAGKRPGRISFFAMRREGRFVCELSDNGHGFDASEAPRLMEAFQRGANPDGRFSPGVGLAVARRIVARHGGTLSISGVRDAGATVVLTLPV